MLRVAAILGILGALAANACANEGEQLFDALKHPAYKKAWAAMLAGEKGVPAWVGGGNLTATPSVVVNADGTGYEFHTACKPHDCGGNALEVMFAIGGGQAWGLLQIEGQTPRFLGKPDAPKRIALERAIRQ